MNKKNNEIIGVTRKIKLLRKERFDLSTKRGMTDMKQNSKKINALINKLKGFTY